MIIRKPRPSDWSLFTSLACAEQWRVPQSELRLFNGPWSDCVYVLDDGVFCGLATAVGYERSAWIGNLIVPDDLRRKGYGSRLFEAVFEQMIAQGLSSVWLTASHQGRSLYEKVGFTVVDMVDRWILSPQKEPLRHSATGHATCEGLFRADHLAWGEQRVRLLAELCKTGRVFSSGHSIAMLQPGADFQVIGPWYSYDRGSGSDLDLMRQLLASRDPKAETVVDLLTSSPMRTICEAFDFQCVGQTALMVYGDIEPVAMKNMMTLASLGSIG